MEENKYTEDDYDFGTDSESATLILIGWLALAAIVAGGIVGIVLAISHA